MNILVSLVFIVGAFAIAAAVASADVAAHTGPLSPAASFVTTSGTLTGPGGRIPPDLATAVIGR